MGQVPPYETMARRGHTKGSEIERITTTQILEKLKEVDDDNTEFFYLCVSTGGKEDELMEIDPASSVPPRPPPKDQDKLMNKARREFHSDILPRILGPEGWKKVYDKDGKGTYRALYFNIIPKRRDEDGISYIKRVNRIRSTLFEEGDKLRTKYDVNFKINSLLSKPFLYDDDYLTEQLQSMRIGHTDKYS